MLIDNLKKMSRDELMAFAASQGIQHHHKAGAEKILQAIVEQLNQPPKPKVEDVVDPRNVATKEPVWNSKEQIDAMLTPILAKQPAFEVHYDDTDRTVTFRCKGVEDCLSMSVPLHWMKAKAQVVARGRIALMGLNQHFDQMNSATGKNAYTNTVLA